MRTAITIISLTILAGCTGETGAPTTQTAATTTATPEPAKPLPEPEATPPAAAAPTELDEETIWRIDQEATGQLTGSSIFRTKYQLPGPNGTHWLIGTTGTPQPDGSRTLTATAVHVDQSAVLEVKPLPELPAATLAR